MEPHLKERMVSLLTLGVGLSILGRVGVNLGQAGNRLERHSSGGGEASGNLSFNSKVMCYNSKNPGHIKCDCLWEKHSFGWVRTLRRQLPEFKKHWKTN